MAARIFDPMKEHFTREMTCSSTLPPGGIGSM
jgi:hypothetical protein